MMAGTWNLWGGLRSGKWKLSGFNSAEAAAADDDDELGTTSGSLLVDADGELSQTNSVQTPE